MRVAYRILYWLAYSVILSLMPIAIGFLFASVFSYPFQHTDALTDLLITDFCLAATILRDSLDGKYAMVSRVIIFSMLIICLISATFYGGISAITGLGIELYETTIQNIVTLVAALTGVTILAGISEQFMETDSGSNTSQ